MHTSCCISKVASARDANHSPLTVARYRLVMYTLPEGRFGGDMGAIRARHRLVMYMLRTGWCAFGERTARGLLSGHGARDTYSTA